MQTFGKHQHLMLAWGSTVVILFGPVEATVKGLAIAGVLLLVLGILSFVVPFPNYHHHGVDVGDAHIGVTTRHDQRVPPVLGIVLVIAGVGLLITGSKS